MTDVANDRETPLVGRNFQVSVTILGPRGGHVADADVACSTVELPPFRLDDRPVRDDSAGPAEPRNLVLCRGHTGAPDFYEWWRAERDAGRNRVREVRVVLLDETHEPVTAWTFTGCHIVNLEYSALDALAVDVVTESLEVAFKKVEQSGRRR